MRSQRARLAVLASGGGTNCQAIIDACAEGRLGADVAVVVTNNAQAGVVERARRAGIEVEIVSHQGRSAAQRADDDQRLAQLLAGYRPDLVVLAGWMRLLGRTFCATFPIINLHPALPGQFAGVRAIERAYQQWQDRAINRSGVMVHWLPDEAVDAGPVIAVREVVFRPGDTLEDFEVRMHHAEHELLIEAIAAALEQLDLAAAAHVGSPDER